MRHLIYILTILIFSNGGLATAGTRYTVTRLGKLPGCDHSMATGVNNKGQIVGQSWGKIGDGPHKWAIFLWEKGRMTEITPPSVSHDWGVVAINDRSQILFRDKTNSYVHQDGNWVKIEPLPGYANVRATALNNRGEVAGMCDNGWPDSRAFLWRNGMTTALPFQDYPLGLGRVLLNNSGQIAVHVPVGPEDYLAIWDSGNVTPVEISDGRRSSYRPEDFADDGTLIGEAVIGDLSAPFVLRDGEMTLLRFPGGGDRAGARYINNHGVIVGWYWNSSLERPLVVRPIAWDADYVPIPLPSLGGGLVTAHAINDSGIIVGDMNKRHAVMWTPVK